MVCLEVEMVNIGCEVVLIVTQYYITIAQWNEWKIDWKKERKNEWMNEWMNETD